MSGRTAQADLGADYVVVQITIKSQEKLLDPVHLYSIHNFSIWEGVSNKAQHSLQYKIMCSFQVLQ